MISTRKAAIALGAVALLVVGWVAPSSSGAATTNPTGYTIAMGEGCELQQLDLVTGDLTDLPAGPSSEACAIDLAAAPNGTVYGVTGGFSRAGSVPQATVSGDIITFAADGTPTAVPITTPGGTEGFMAIGGIAVSPGGTVYVHLVVDEAGCDTGTTPDTSMVEPLYAGDSVCLYTIDPTTGAANLVGTTGLFETIFFGIASCGSLVTLAIEDETGATWGTESATSGAVTLGPVAESLPIGYDCDSTAGSPLWALDGAGEGPLTSLQDTEVEITQVDPATGAVTSIVPVSDPAADLMALAVVPSGAVQPDTEADADDVVAPAFTG